MVISKKKKKSTSVKKRVSKDDKDFSEQEKEVVRPHLFDEALKREHYIREPSEAEEKKSGIFFSSFSNKIGIDLGTASTVVHVEGRGIILRESTLVAVNKKTEKVIAVGKKARMMVGRTPEHIVVIQPVREGVVSDYEVTEQLFEYIFRKAQDLSPKIFSPIVIIGIPCRVSKTEINALRDAATDAGARKVYIVHEPLAAAVGMNLSLDDEEATMVIDVGGGTSDSMIFSGGEVIADQSLRIAGDALDAAIVRGLKNKKNLIIGDRTAEDLKLAIMQSIKDKKVFLVQGRNTANGLPLEIEVSLEEILDYISPCLDTIAKHIRLSIESVSPEILTDLKNKKIYFVGGGPAIHTFSEKIEKELNLKVIVPENPLTVVARGTAVIAKNPDKYRRYFQ